MNENNFLQKYKNNFFSKLLMKIKSLFHKNIDKEHIININNLEYKNDKIDNNSNQAFLDQIKVDKNLKNTEYEKKEFMKRLKERPDMLENFSNDRLELILQYYLDDNEKKRNVLKKLIEQ